MNSLSLENKAVFSFFLKLIVTYSHRLVGATLSPNKQIRDE
jgi:hypothetical protein